jgi:glycosyltransferase involved in cell wall biosynthesis
MSQAVELSVVIAAYNEEAVIEKNIVAVLDYLRRQNRTWELICVDDGSSDDTGRRLDRLAETNESLHVFHHRRNFGQGQALRSAFAQARGQVVVTLDADLSYGPEYIGLLGDALAENKADIALASCYMKGGQVRNVPFHRRFLSRAGNWYHARMSDYPISTSTCVVRAYLADALHEMRLTSSGMELQLEILTKASLHNLRVAEIPAILHWEKHKAAEASLRRVSKMRIFRAIYLYLKLGWLAKPAKALLMSSLLFLLPGLYMAAVLGCRFLARLLAAVPDRGLSPAVSESLANVFAHYTYSLVFCGIFLFLGFQLSIFSLLFLQAKHYYDESYLRNTPDRLSEKLAAPSRKRD